MAGGTGLHAPERRTRPSGDRDRRVLASVAQSGPIKTANATEVGLHAVSPPNPVQRRIVAVRTREVESHAATPAGGIKECGHTLLLNFKTDNTLLPVVQLHWLKRTLRSPSGPPAPVIPKKRNFDLPRKRLKPWRFNKILDLKAPRSTSKKFYNLLTLNKIPKNFISLRPKTEVDSIQFLSEK